MKQMSAPMSGLLASPTGASTGFSPTSTASSMASTSSPMSGLMSGVDPAHAAHPAFSQTKPTNDITQHVNNHINSFLATPQGQDLIGHMMPNHPELKAVAGARAIHHANYMKAQGKTSSSPMDSAPNP